AALGLLLFGTFNVISVAFIPLFVGLGIDFGIQFAVRFRSEQRTAPSVAQALVNGGAGIGRSLVLAATAVSVGFLAFLPTNYRGVSQLGAIAGCGFLLALVLSLPFFPALLKIAAPRAFLMESGSPALTAVDAFVLGRRRIVLGTAAIAALICL